MFENTKGVIRRLDSTIAKRTNNNLQYTTQKTYDQTIRTAIK